MADEAKAAESAEETKKTVAKDMPNRRVFGSVGEAKEYLGGCADLYSDWGDESIPFAAVGVNEEGDFDESIYNDSMDVMVAKLTKQKTEKAAGGVKAIVVAPIPKLDLTSAGDEALQGWIRRILHKELNHVAVRALREAEDVSTVIDQMPTTVTGYIESAQVSGGIMEAFNELYKLINGTLGAKVPVWAKYRLIKSELKKAMESKGYAMEIYPALEDYRGNSLFEVAIQLGQASAKRKGLDPAIFDRWAETRATKKYDPAAPTDEDEDELDIGNLTDSLLADDAEAEESTDADADDSGADANDDEDGATA